MKKEVLNIYLKSNCTKEIHYYYRKLIEKCNRFISLQQLADMSMTSLSHCKQVATGRILPNIALAKLIADLAVDCDNFKLLLENKYGY